MIFCEQNLGYIWLLLQFSTGFLFNIYLRTLNNFYVCNAISFIYQIFLHVRLCFLIIEPVLLNMWFPLILTVTLE